MLLAIIVIMGISLAVPSPIAHTLKLRDKERESTCALRIVPDSKIIFRLKIHLRSSSACNPTYHGADGKPNPRTLRHFAGFRGNRIVMVLS